MSIESGAKFNHESATGGTPNREDLSREDCTLALLADAIKDQDPSSLTGHVIDAGSNHTTLDCKACPAKLELTHFANVIGSTACKSLFRHEANQTIIDSSR